MDIRKFLNQTPTPEHGTPIEKAESVATILGKALVDEIKANPTVISSMFGDIPKKWYHGAHKVHEIDAIVEAGKDNIVLDVAREFDIIPSRYDVVGESIVTSADNIGINAPTLYGRVMAFLNDPKTTGIYLCLVPMGIYVDGLGTPRSKLRVLTVIKRPYGESNVFVDVRLLFTETEMKPEYALINRKSGASFPNIL